MPSSSKVLFLRLSESEYDRLEKEAAQAQQRITTFAKQKLLHGDYLGADRLENFVRALRSLATATWEIQRQQQEDCVLPKEAYATLKDIDRQLVNLRQSLLGK